MSKFVELAAKLDQIPHLHLGRTFDVARLQAELDAIDPALFVPYRSVSKYQQFIADNWQGLSMVAPYGSVHGDLTEEFNRPRTDSTWTPVAEQCPYMKEVITELGGEGQRVRFMRVKPEGRLTWHRHGNETSIENGKVLGGLRPNWFELIVHVPIRTNPDFSYEVIEVPSYQLVDFMTEPLAIHRKNYPAGEAWGFNSVHVHNVFNRSKTEPRYALMLSLDIRMRKTFDIVTKAVERYIANNEGPLIK
jgi:Aspartyl/Asparaginyl beta-hydroxylase